MIDYDPETYKEATFIRIQHSTRARWHGTVKVLVLFYYKTHRVQKGEALFNKPPAELRRLVG